MAWILLAAFVSFYTNDPSMKNTVNQPPYTVLKE